ncbi:NAD(P)-dependent oxidoreductase [Marinicrinis lubricantis]|uniref:NAD(P)-dependent oxidoreductase n=1 Tax=Marinicrinis lubricantis TaxID=2086470 RepID=A0ABW1IL28_9BACL
MKEHPKIGMIGTGVMGQSMAGHLLSAGYTVHVYNRTKQKAEPLLEKGAVWFDQPGKLAEQSDIVITMVGFPQDVESLYLDSDGILAHAKPGSIVIDMTTSSPQLAQTIFEHAEQKQIYALDAPVSGGDVGAREARLSIMVGGERNVFEAALPIFQKMGRNIVYQGKAGAGQYTKLSNQIAVASTMIAVAEALVFAEKAGLDPFEVLRSIESGAAGSWTMSNLGPRMLKGDFAPGFYVKHFLKDLKIAIEAAEQLGIQLEGLRLAKRLYDQLSAQGESDRGTQVLYQLLKQQG